MLIPRTPTCYAYNSQSVINTRQAQTRTLTDAFASPTPAPLSIDDDREQKEKIMGLSVCETQPQVRTWFLSPAVIMDEQVSPGDEQNRR